MTRFSQPSRSSHSPGNASPRSCLSRRGNERDAQPLVDRCDAVVFALAPDTVQDLIDKYAVTAVQAGDGSPDVLNGLRPLLELPVELVLRRARAFLTADAGPRRHQRDGRTAATSDPLTQILRPTTLGR